MAYIFIGYNAAKFPINAGPAADRPAAGSKDGAAGHEYWENDGVKTHYVSDGTGWNQISSGGAAHVTDAMYGTSTVMITNATATGTAASMQLTPPLKSKCTYLTTIGGNNAVAVTATVKVYGSLVAMASAGAADKVELATLSLSGTGVTNNDTVVDTDAVAVGEHYYPYIWMEVTAISGTGAKVITGRRLT